MAYLIDSAGTRVRPGSTLRKGDRAVTLVGFASRPQPGKACRLLLSEGGRDVVDYAHTFGLRYVETLPPRVKANEPNPAASLQLAAARPDILVQSLGAWFGLLAEAGADGGAYLVKVLDRGETARPGWRYVAYPWGGRRLLARGDALGTVALRSLVKVGA